jgi:hypothetical protein
MGITTFTLLAALGLALVHVFAGKMRFLAGIPRSRWLSAAGGVSVAYVFLHLLPELAEAQEEFRGASGPVLGFVERHVYLVALIGLALFYGLDHLAQESRRRQQMKKGEDETAPGVFWLHIVSFGLYNLLIGYLLLHREEHSLGSLGIYFVAMALHFVVNDFALWEHHKEKYSRAGRWIIAAAVLLGWGVGALTEVDRMLIAVLLAFLAGGIVLNVLKEEVPGERQSRFWAFALGMGGYAALLLVM